jgi:hypothetical protein
MIKKKESVNIIGNLKERGNKYEWWTLGLSAIQTK